MNAFWIVGIVLSFGLFLFGWALMLISVNPDADEIERYEQMVAWFESVFE